MDGNQDTNQFAGERMIELRPYHRTNALNFGFWVEDGEKKLQLLREWHTAGWSYAMMAAMFSRMYGTRITRNVPLAKAHRLKLGRRAESPVRSCPNGVSSGGAGALHTAKKNTAEYIAAKQEALRKVEQEYPYRPGIPTLGADGMGLPRPLGPIYSQRKRGKRRKNLPAVQVEIKSSKPLPKPTNEFTGEDIDPNDATAIIAKTYSIEELNSIGAVKIGDLHTGMCKYPYTITLDDPEHSKANVPVRYCGKPCHGNKSGEGLSSWCPNHFARVFNLIGKASANRYADKVAHGKPVGPVPKMANHRKLLTSMIRGGGY